MRDRPAKELEPGRSLARLGDHAAHLIARKRAHRGHTEVALGREPQSRRGDGFIVGSLHDRDEIVLDMAAKPNF